MSLSGWDANKIIQCSVPGQLSTLTDFPVLIYIGASSGVTSLDNTAVFDDLGSNSKKIAVEIGDTGVQCYVEIERWDSTGEHAWLHVKIPSYLLTAATILNFYYDSAHADNTTYVGDVGSTPAQAVWDSYFVGVWHMAQDPSGTSPQMLDSTPNAGHGTTVGSMTSGDLVDGPVGKAIDLDGTDDGINAIPHNTGFDADTFTVEAMVVDQPVGSHAVFHQGDVNVSGGSGVVVRITASKMDLMYNDAGGGTWYYPTSIESVPSTGTPYLAWVVDGGAYMTPYIEGVAGTPIALSGTFEHTTYPAAIGARRLGAGLDTFYANVLEEIRYSKVLRSADWIAATKLSLTDTLITFSIPSGKLQAIVNMPYGDLIAYNQAIVDMTYIILFSRLSFINMQYSIKMATLLSMYYGNSPELKNINNQYYSDAPGLLNKVDMEYGDMLMLRQYSDMPYTIPFELKRILEMKYSLTGEPLINILNQQYSLLLNDIIRKKLDQIYMLQEGNKLSQVSTSVIIGGNFVNPHHVNVEYSIDSFVASGEVHLASEEEYIKIHQGDDVEITINGETHIFIVDTEPKRSRSGAAKTNYVIECVSPAIKLTSPWGNTLTCSFDADTASNIFETLAYPIIVYWAIVDFPIIKDTLYANNEDRMSVMRKITQSAGAIIQSNPDGSIRVIYRYQKPVNDWNDAIPDYYLTDSLNFISQDETFKHNSGINKYIVSNASTPEDRIWIEQDDYPNVIAFEVPWKGTNMSLEHSGGSGVNTPEYMGVIELMYPPGDEDAEQLEFVAGFSTTSRPIYTESLNGEQAPVQITWIREQLGSLTISEDGRLEAEYKTGDTDGYSLAEIRYLTRYNLWKVNNGTEQNVQYILRIDGDYETNASCF